MQQEPVSDTPQEGEAFTTPALDEKSLDTGRVVVVPAGDVTTPPSDGEGLTTTQRFAVKQTAEDASDFMVYVRASVLRRVRRRLQLAVESGFPWEEILLGLATTSIGAFLGGLGIDRAAFPTARLLTVQICPIIAAASFVGYLWTKSRSTTAAATSAREALLEVPDPDDAKAKENL